MAQSNAIFWFRNDLRLADNPGLYNAAQHENCYTIYIDNPKLHAGAASKWWLNSSLASLNTSLHKKLNLYQGDPNTIIFDLIAQYKIDHVYFNTSFEPEQNKIDVLLTKKLKSQGVNVIFYNASLLWDPNDVLKPDGSGAPYKVFTPFYRNAVEAVNPPRLPMPMPKPQLGCLKFDNDSLQLKQLNLLPKIKWYEKFESLWDIGEDAANTRLCDFIENDLDGYSSGRNFLSQSNVSRLSPHLHFGEISPNQIWYKVHQLKDFSFDAKRFLTEIGWREFSYNLLYHFPKLSTENYQSKFDNFPWQQDDSMLKAWQQGKTGFPLVDAGMRELYQTGYMHNRVRMVVASFLVKNLLIDWRYGHAWFDDCLCDADLANNSASWQWVAGCGADAAPYFRIFNPVLQGEKFDASGLYTKKYVPELKDLPNKYLFKPWEASADILKSANVVLGENYPKPLVNLKHSRERALSALKKMRLN